ncbi:hypothetical protein DOTSEDRAFT_154659 [Dothistroma septosporum NZE10]|uniref:Uncharacterized protein n=1 Tax=Dothistroma septosporum (strain NZE10 / CBS 128990) TaxID=675120 RepID=N1PKN3_DOTSN|nr:hypothetical protein DOTSEDRAFT_154659 [Dothistroma septosporum NZE10]
MTTLPSMSCPSGGIFYACSEGSRFIGCCTANPCGSNGCPAGNLKATGMTASQYGHFPDEDCDSTSAQFYSCNTTTPTF